MREIHIKFQEKLFRRVGELCNKRHPDGWRMKDFTVILQNVKEGENPWGIEIKDNTYDINASRRTFFHERSPSSCQFWFRAGRFKENGMHENPCFVNKELAEINAIHGWDKVYKKNTGRRGYLWKFVPDLDLQNWDNEQYGPLPDKNEQINKQHRRDVNITKGTRSYKQDIIPHRIAGYRNGPNKEQVVGPVLLGGL